MRGLSPLVATVILLAAVLSIGYVVYNYVYASAGAVAQKPQLLITVDAAEVAGTLYIELSIKNVGGAPINLTSITIDNNDVSNQLNLPLVLEPGSVLHRVVSLALTPGEHIVIVKGVDNAGNVYEFKAKFIG